MNNYEEWTELFKEEVQNHLELILQNDYDEHYYASYLKSLEETPGEITTDAHEIEEESVIEEDNNQTSMQVTTIIALALFSCALLWLSLQIKKKWKKSINLDNTKELPYFHTNPTV